MRLTRVLCAALLGVAPASLAAQTPSDGITGRCPVWDGLDLFRDVPGHAGYSVCAVDRRPVPLEGNPMPSVPRFPGTSGGELLVMVSSDGAVDSTRSGYVGISASTHLVVAEPAARSFTEDVRRTVHAWRFRPGERRGEPVRVAVRLSVRLEEKPYTGPTRPAWRYVPGARQDSLVLEWEPLPALPPLGRDARHAMTLAAVRALADSGALRSGQRYCVGVEADSADPAPQADAAAARVRALLASRGVTAEPHPACYRAGIQFLGVSRVFRPLDEVGVVWFEAHFPTPGSRHRPWPEWNARCHVERVRAEWTARCALDPRALPAAARAVRPGGAEVPPPVRAHHPSAEADERG